MMINATYIHKVAESEGGTMEAMIGEEEHAHDSSIWHGSEERTTVMPAKQKIIAIQYLMMNACSM